MKAESARVSIRNGSTLEGLAALSAQYFQQQGVNVAEQGTGDPSGFSYIIDITGKPYTLAYFTNVLQALRLPRSAMPATIPIHQWM